MTDQPQGAGQAACAVRGDAWGWRGNPLGADTMRWSGQAKNHDAKNPTISRHGKVPFARALGCDGQPA